MSCATCCNLSSYVCLSISLGVYACLHVCFTACACWSRDMLHHNQSTRSHFVHWNPVLLNADAHFERTEEKSDAPANVAECALKCLHTQQRMLQNKSTKQMCGSHSSLVPVAVDWSLWWVGLRVTVGNWVQRTGPCMVKSCRPSFLWPYERLFWGIFNSPTQAQQFWG